MRVARRLSRKCFLVGVLNGKRGVVSGMSTGGDGKDDLNNAIMSGATQYERFRSSSACNPHVRISQHEGDTMKVTPYQMWSNFT